MATRHGSGGEVLPLFLDVKTIAKLLSISERMVWRLKDAGHMPQPVKVGRLVRWRRKDIEQWVEHGCPKRRW